MKPLGMPFAFGWTGCPAEDACLHELWDGKSVALCRACSRAKPRHDKAKARYVARRIREGG